MTQWKPDYFKLVVAGAASLYFFSSALHPTSDRYIDAVNLVIHEAGHIVFVLFGEMMAVAGGTILQLLMPALFVGYFALRQREYFSASLVVFWLGENFITISVYAADALAMQLPLVGGEGVIHDWNYLLTRAGMLEHTWVVAGIIKYLGMLTILFASIGSFWFALRKRGGTFTTDI